jgi:hypothetical protein
MTRTRRVSHTGTAADDAHVDVQAPMSSSSLAVPVTTLIERESGSSGGARRVANEMSASASSVIKSNSMNAYDRHVRARTRDPSHRSTLPASASQTAVATPGSTLTSSGGNNASAVVLLGAVQVVCARVVIACLTHAHTGRSEEAQEAHRIRSGDGCAIADECTGACTRSF